MKTNIFFKRFFLVVCLLSAAAHIHAMQPEKTEIIGINYYVPSAHQDFRISIPLHDRTTFADLKQAIFHQLNANPQTKALLKKDNINYANCTECLTCTVMQSIYPVFMNNSDRLLDSRLFLVEGNLGVMLRKPRRLESVASLQNALLEIDESDTQDRTDQSSRRHDNRQPRAPFRPY